MERVSLWPAVLGLALAMIVVALIEPVPHSLSYASGVVVLIALLGWVMEARQVAGPPPEVEPEEEEEEEAPGPSYWPVVLAVGILGIAAGLIYTGSFAGIDNFWDYGALLVAIPMAAASGGAWMAVLRDEMLPTAEEAAEAAAGPPIVASGGRVLTPVAPNALATEAAGGAAIAIERVETKQVSRRSLIQITFWAGLGSGLLAIAGSLVDFLYPRGIIGFGGVVTAGTIDQFPPGTKTQVPAGKFWLVNLTAEQGGPGYLALWWKCPHLGCTVPWREGFSWPNAEGVNTLGWFRCPCHGSTYNHAGVRVFGPAPRSMDRMEITIDSATGRIDVNTGSISKGTPDNADFAVQA
jgi:cytochrome b6-f complex iron-sulfur subunit